MSVCWMTLTLGLHDTARSGFGSPPSPSVPRANPPSQHDSLFAFGSNQQQQQYQQTQAPPPGFGGMRGSGGGHQSKGVPPLGSGRGLETMPEDDTMVSSLSSMSIFHKQVYFPQNKKLLEHFECMPLSSLCCWGICLSSAHCVHMA